MENDRVVVARERERHASGLLLARVRTQMMDVYRPLAAAGNAAFRARLYMARELGFEWLTLTVYDAASCGRRSGSTRTSRSGHPSWPPNMGRTHESRRGRRRGGSTAQATSRCALSGGPSHRYSSLCTANTLVITT